MTDEHSTRQGNRQTSDTHRSMASISRRSADSSCRSTNRPCRFRFSWLLVVPSFVSDLFSALRGIGIRTRQWFLLEGNRLPIAGGLVLFVFAGSIILSLTDVIDISQQSFVTTMFSTMIAGMLSLAPIIIAVNQLALSQLFSTPKELREQIDSVDAFRAGIAQQFPDKSVTPTEPAQFLLYITGIVTAHTQMLRQTCADEPDEQLRDRIDEFVDVILSRTEMINSRLQGTTNPRLITVLLPMMGAEYSRSVNITRALQHDYFDTLSGRTYDLLDDLRELFVALDVSRQYFKALYLHQELASMSRLIAYTGTASVLMSMFLLMLFANGRPPVDHPVLLRSLVALALAVSFAPMAVLLTYIARIATIAKRTAAPGAFTPRNETPDHKQRRY